MSGYVIFAIAAGLFVFLGDTPGWSRTIFGFAIALVTGLAVDFATPMVMGIFSDPVVVRLSATYGLSLNGLLYLPLALIAVTVAARQRWVRRRDPNDLRN